MKIKIMEQKLTDGSKVFDVVLIADGVSVTRFPCVTEGDAKDFADKLVNSINAHSVIVARHAFA